MAAAQAVASAGGLALWANAGAGFEELLRLCVSWLNHASLAVSDAFAAVLGAAAAAAKHSSALAAVRTLPVHLNGSYGHAYAGPLYLSRPTVTVRSRPCKY